jgi:hypothetical protein
MSGRRLARAWPMTLLGATLLLLPRIALAEDWEFAKWGMTVDEVHAAAGGIAVPCDEVSCKNKSSRSDRAMLLMPMTVEGFEMVVYFTFDRKTERLTTVGMAPRDQIDNDRWLRETRIKLKKLHGPYKEELFFGVALWNWQRDDGSRIQLMAQTEQDPDNVYLSYTSKEGLTAEEAAKEAE